MNEIRVTTELISNELLEQVEYLYAQEPFKTALWQWQFKSRFGRTPLAVVARDRGRVIGFNGTMPVKLRTAVGQLINGTWSCDFIVAEAYRGRGVGTAIKDEMFSHLAKPIMSLGISDTAYPLLVKKGGHSPSNLSVFHLVNNASGFKQHLFKWYSSACKSIHSFAIKRSIKYFHVDELSALPNDDVINVLCAKHYEQMGANEIYRDYEYLHWRYSEPPFAASTYRFLAVSVKGERICALVVFRLGRANSLEVVDFLGDLAYPQYIFSVCNYFQKLFPSISLLTWNTSCSTISTFLTEFGFIRKSYSTRFVAFADDDSRWNLSAGDSDGDFLHCAREYFLQDAAKNETQARSARTIPTDVSDVQKVAQWVCADGFEYHCVDSIGEFQALKMSWSLLNAQCNANPLFMSWGWLYSWWSIWGEKLGLKLSIYLIYKEYKLCGIVPLYCYKKNGVSHFQFIGNAWGIAQTVRSEYMSPLFKNEYSAALDTSFSTFFKKLNPWSILSVPDANVSMFGDLHSLVLKHDTGYRISTNSSFSEYLKNLGRQTRLKAFGRRRQLQDQGTDLSLSAINETQESSINFFSQLNSFHLMRWGKPCFDKYAVEFHRLVLMLNTNMKPNLSVLKVDAEIVSSSYNLECDGVMYNIQSGYLENFDRKVSLGTLHMGWEIEKSFSNDTIIAFDFLAGFGKVEDYKRHYRGEQIDFYSRQFFSSTSLYCLFCLIASGKRFFKTIWRRR
jgi:GNAT superfamily N-acetyltransferase